MTRYIGLLFLTLAITCTATQTTFGQWEDHITCHEAFIDLRPVDSWSGYIPRCMDTLRIGYTRAMQRSTSSVDTVCASLFRMQRINGKPVYDEVQAQITCVGPSQLTVIPTAGLPAADNDGVPITYMIQMYCNYWHGEGEYDTTRMFFAKADGFKAYARAVDSETGEDITELGLVKPTFENKDHSLQDGMMLTGFYGQGYAFERWTTTDVDLLPDPLASRQFLDSLCWPVGRSVEYIGHFKKTATGVTPLVASQRTVEHRSSAIRIRSDSHGPYTVSIYDLQGRSTHESIEVGAETTIDIGHMSCGLYAVVIQDPHQSTIHPIIITTENQP
ncbi:MAG: T9SS type A sorting domain-containing protein [Ignavibacteria bacterium]|nr:T9SS type A sorting domain-containing protein [Ignavibacteria bacterium]